MTESRAPMSRHAVRVVPVLGMHRSGTSMFTRALNLMGVALGTPLIGPQPDNPKGFWENEFFYQVNVRLLHALGCHPSGYGPAARLLEVPALSARLERTETDLAAIEDYLTATFATAPLWGWKDPRSVLLFPFWLSGLVELGFHGLCPAIITRHPSAVVRSLAGRADLDGLARTLDSPVDQLALEMWTAYTHVLLDISDQTDCFVSVCEWYLEADRARSELARCADYLGLSPGDTGLDAAVEWLDPGAVHHGEPESLDLPGADEALVLWDDLTARARAQAAGWVGAAGSPSGPYRPSSS